jgi:hypothetical protein
MSNITKMSSKRVEMLKTSMDANDRTTDETSMKRHIKNFKDFVNNVDDFDDKKIEAYCREYCGNDDNFEEIEVVEKPKRTLSDEQKAKMKAGREKAKAEREASGEVKKPKARAAKA